MGVAHRIYAEALLDAAESGGHLDAVRAEFGEFVASVGENPELRNLLRNPQIDMRTKGDVLASVLSDSDEVFRNFVGVLVEKHRIAEIESIHEEWERLLAARERVLEVELTTAVELSDDEAQAIVARIEEAAGRRVEATRSVDVDLIGGLVLQAGSRRVDASVRGRLNQLREELLVRS